MSAFATFTNRFSSVLGLTSLMALAGLAVVVQAKGRTSPAGGRDPALPAADGDFPGT
jgi:hypothetical protein